MFLDPEYEDRWPYGRPRPVTADASKQWNGGGGDGPRQGQHWATPTMATPMTAKQKLESRQIEGSPWRPQGKPPQSADSLRVRCQECGRLFLTADHLSIHIESAHTPKLPRARGGVTRSAIEAITSRIADGTFKPGDPVRQNELAEEIGVSGGAMSAAVSQLAAEGVLGYAGTGFQRRAHVQKAYAL
jgi:hypothetical protein